MQTVLNAPNQPLRDAITYRRAPLDLLLASTVALAHGDTLQLTQDGLLETYTDHDALVELAEPADGQVAPYVAIGGDDLVVFAAANDVGVHVNPGSRDDLVLGAGRVNELAQRIRTKRSSASVRRLGDERVLVTMRRSALALEEDRLVLLRRELAARGIQIAYVVEYALHDAITEPREFTQLMVVGDEDGNAAFQMREDARRVMEFLSGRAADAVAFNAMPQAAQVAQPVVCGEHAP